MIVGGSKKEVIENIQKNIEANELNKKVELNDPSFTEEQSKKILDKFYRAQEKKISHFFKSRFAYAVINIVGKKINDSIEVKGLENLDKIKGGAIVTSNHFNPIDTLIPRKAIRKKFKKNIYIVSQETNLMLPGILGFLVRNFNIIPLGKNIHYIQDVFKVKVSECLKKGNYVLIYPEEEMWFNYRKPRPCKRGAYQLAAENNVPIISCFTQMIDCEDDDNEEFKNVKYIIHVLKPIYPNPELSVRQNSIEMAQLDYEQKKEAYEKCYKKKLDYKFSYEDIAGYKGR